MGIRPVTVAETPEFEKAAKGLLTGTEYYGLVEFIAYNPTSGAIIPGTGGVRKLRWAAKGKGKRGGVRAIYYFHNRAMPVFMITVYGKGGKDNLSNAERNQMKTLTRVLVDSYGE